MQTLAKTTGTESKSPVLCVCSLAPVRSGAAVALARGVAMGGKGTVSILRRIHGPHVRRASLVAALVFSGFILVACGDDDDDKEPTKAATQATTTQVTPATTTGSPAASPRAGASPVASPRAGASPVASTPAASPEASPAS